MEVADGLIQTASGKRGGFRGAVDEAFGVKGPGGLQGTSALNQHIKCSVMMDIIGGEHRDPGMAVLGVVQPKNDRQKAMAAVMSSKRPGKPE